VQEQLVPSPFIFACRRHSISPTPAGAIGVTPCQQVPSPFFFTNTHWSRVLILASWCRRYCPSPTFTGLGCYFSLVEHFLAKCKAVWQTCLGRNIPVLWRNIPLLQRTESGQAMDIIVVTNIVIVVGADRHRHCFGKR
jgi:hypothetical protein